MKWAYDLCGAEPIIKDEPVYDSATIAYGELVMLGATAFSAGADAGVALISAVPDTVGGTQAVNAVGIALETKTTADSPSVATAWNTTAATVGCYAKVIVNPFAVYRSEVGTDGFSIASSASTDEFAVTGVGQNSLNGQWCFFSASDGPNFGELRRIVSSAAGSTCNLDNAVSATITTADEVVVVAQKNQYANILGATAVSTSQTTVGGNTADNLRVIESYVSTLGGSHGPLEILEARHNNVKLTNASKVRFYNDLVMKDHAFGVQE